METVRFYGNYQLLHNTSLDENHNKYYVTDGTNKSHWLYTEDKYDLIDLSDYDFEEKCIELIQNNK